MSIETPLSETNIVLPTCKSCSTAVTVNDQFCQSCGFPLKGTEEEQTSFIYNRGYKQIELQEMEKKVKSASTTLYVLAGLFLLWGIVYFFMNSGNDTGPVLLITNGVLAVIFLVLAFWAPKKPVAAIISGLSLYGLVLIINVIEDPASIIKGIIIKILIISYLIKGLTSAFEAEKIRKQFNIS